MELVMACFGSLWIFWRLVLIVVNRLGRFGSQFLVSTPREDKAFFLPRSCILILKFAKNFRENFFRGVELIRVEVMYSRETWRHNDIQKEIQNGVGMVAYN